MEVYQTQLSTVIPISKHPSYLPIYDSSDKAILPHSLYLVLKRRLIQPPYFFYVRTRPKQKPTFCGALEFSAQENSIYCSKELLYRIGISTLNNMKTGIFLQFRYSNKKIHPLVPALQCIQLELPEYLDTDLCRRSLSCYTIIQPNDTLTLALVNSVIKAKVVSTEPLQTCCVTNDYFQIFVVVKQAQQKKQKRIDRKFQLSTRVIMPKLPEYKIRFQSIQKLKHKLSNRAKLNNKNSNCVPNLLEIQATKKQDRPMFLRAAFPGMISKRVRACLQNSPQRVQDQTQSVRWATNYSELVENKKMVDKETSTINKRSVSSFEQSFNN